MSRVEPNRNVYVGHRYVPKIMGEWDKKNQYEGLSIVTHQGNSYTSKKRVPVGIDILNEEFWVVTGNYNAQIEDYREETKRVAKDLLLKSDKTYVDTELGKKADISFVNTELDKKADTSFVNTELDKKADTSFVDTELDKKADVTTVENIEVSVKKFGAVGNGITDDTTAIQDTIDYVSSRGGGTVKFIPGETYRTTETLRVTTDGVKLYGNGAIIEYDRLTGTALQLGKASGNTRRLGYTDLTIMKKNKSWENDSVGVEITSVVWSTIDGIEVEGFKKGLLLNSYVGGCSYNRFNLRRIFDNETNIMLDSMGQNGWVNENTFYDGNMSVSSSRTEVEREKATNLIITEGTNSIINNNRFFSPTFEGKDVKAIESRGSYTIIYSPRFEGSLYVELMGVGSAIFHGRGLARRYITLGARCQYFGSDGVIINGSTLNDNEGAITSKNSSSALNPVYTGLSPTNDVVFSVNGQGLIEGRNIIADKQDSEFRNINSRNGYFKGLSNNNNAVVDVTDSNNDGRIFSGKNSVGNETFSVGTNGKIKGVQLELDSQILFKNDRKIVFNVGEPTENMAIGTIYVNTLGGVGKTLWIKESVGMDGWKSL